MTTLKAGDKIAIHGEKSFSDDALVASICHVDDLPELPGFDHARVRECLQDGHFEHMALIEYKFLDETLAFCAFEDTSGRWWDLKGQRLIIEPRTATNQQREMFATQRRYPD